MKLFLFLLCLFFFSFLLLKKTGIGAGHPSTPLYLLSPALKWRLQFYLKKRPWHRCFPVNYAKFLRTAFLSGHLRWLFLKRLHKIIILVLLCLLNFVSVFLKNWTLQSKSYCSWQKYLIIKTLGMLQVTQDRSSHLRCSVRKVALRNFT